MLRENGEKIMKALNHEEFVKMPSGTIFYMIHYRDTWEGYISVKRETNYSIDDYNIGFLYNYLYWNQEDMENYYEIFGNGYSNPMILYPLNSKPDRVEVNTQIYVVYEREDLLLMKEIIDNAISVTETEG